MNGRNDVGGAGAAGVDPGGVTDSLNVDADREVGNTACRSRSDLTSLEYFSVFIRISECYNS